MRFLLPAGLALCRLTEGKTAMELKYARPWEKTEPPAHTASHVVVVTAGKDDGKK